MTQTDYYVQQVLNSVFHGVEFRVLVPYVGLGYDDGSGGILEVSASDYSRQPIVFDTAQSDGSIYSAQEISWNPTSDWGTLKWAFIADAAQGGNTMFTDAIGTVPAGAGSTILINPADLYVT